MTPTRSLVLVQILNSLVVATVCAMAFWSWVTASLLVGAVQKGAEEFADHMLIEHDVIVTPQQIDRYLNGYGVADRMSGQAIWLWITTILLLGISLAMTLYVVKRRQQMCLPNETIDQPATESSPS